MGRKYDDNGFPTMTSREKELENLVRKLRVVIFTQDDGYADKASRVLKKALKRLRPYNDDRSYEVRRRAGDRYMRLME